MGSVLLTGANGSLAIPAVSYLLSKYPSCTAILTIRNVTEQGGTTARLRETIASFPHAHVSIRQLDLASLSSIQTFAAEVHADVVDGKLPPLIAIICNAYTWCINGGIQYSEDGFERSMAVNYLGHFALILRLLNNMDRSGRIMFLSSESHEPGRAGFEKYPPVLPGDLDLLVHPPPDRKGEEVGRGFLRYGLSKLATVMGMYELQRRLKTTEDFKEIAVIAMDPGGLLDSKTFAGPDVPALWTTIINVLNWLQPLLKLLKPTLRRTAHAAEDLIDLSIDPKFAGQEGHFEMNRKVASSPASMDESMQAALWTKTLEWSRIGQSNTALPLHTT
ncbi:short-chain dehydrogenase/reductase-like protein sdr [Amniculicola lignicola CBS 123094]|uniref:3beta-hydroxysteroid 3-dehydrogenase n=1 Tax=Amniculicola lignicola CBS 123094 TaxID=1392246 RepID=A0A6A5WEF5_9PLEO|nr:short-chain dehydrogenase/reductase-like protein sdr [Amniculicola lignicola CBS 123094]